MKCKRIVLQKCSKEVQRRRETGELRSLSSSFTNSFKTCLSKFSALTYRHPHACVHNSLPINRSRSALFKFPSILQDFHSNYIFSLFQKQLESAFPLVIWQPLLTFNNNPPPLHIWIVHCFLSVLLVTPTSIVITEKTPQLGPIASLLHSSFIAFDFWHSREIWELREKRKK